MRAWAFLAGLERVFGSVVSPGARGWSPCQSQAVGFAFPPSGAAWYQRLVRWGSTPKTGAVIFYKFPGGPNRIHHVGLVAGVQGNVIETIKAIHPPALRETSGKGEGSSDAAAPVGSWDTATRRTAGNRSPIEAIRSTIPPRSESRSCSGCSEARTTEILAKRPALPATPTQSGSSRR